MSGLFVDDETGRSSRSFEGVIKINFTEGSYLVPFIWIHRTPPLRSWLGLVGDTSSQSRDREGGVDPHERDDGLN